jgi:hypothetical protein
MELARANAIQAESAQAASSTQSGQDAQDSPSSTPAAAPASGSTPSDMFSGQTLGALTSVQEGASNLRQSINSDGANQIVSQFGSNGEISLSQIETALGGSSSASAASGSTSSATVSTLDGMAGAFASLDTNGDGELSTGELTNALNQMTGPGQVAGHHGHHHHHGGGGGDAQASDGSLTLSDIESALNTLTASLNGASGSGSATSSNTVSTLDGSTSSGGASSASKTTSSNTASTLNGLTTTEITQALQAFLNSLAQSQAANIAALGQTINPTSVTA